MAKERIIFLDIDGPMIPGTAYLDNVHCSWEQELYYPCVNVLRKILDASGAKIVFNTSHNVGRYFYSLVQKFEEQGFKNDIHEVKKTLYPSPPADMVVDRGSDFSESGQRRLACAKWWLKENAKSEQTLWVIFDDIKIDHKRAIHVDFDSGLTLSHYNQAAHWLQFKPFFVL